MTPTFPNPLAFAWLFFMRPISLHRRLVALGIETPPGVPNPTVLGGSQWRWRYLASLALVAIGVPFAGTFALTLPLARFFGLEVAPKMAAAGVAFGLVWGGIVGLALGVGFALTLPPAKASRVLSLGVALGVAGGLQFGAAFGVEGKLAAAIVGGLAFGTAGAAGWSSQGSPSGGISFSIGLGIAMSMMFGWPGVLAGMVAALRLPFYLVEALWQLLLLPFTRRGSLRLSAVFAHELSYFPLPGLRGQIVRTHATRPDLAFRAIAACALAPGQRQAGLEAAEAIDVVPPAE